MAGVKRHNDVPIEEVPEVAQFEAVKSKYEAFREANPEFFQYLEGIMTEYNIAHESAMKAVRARGVSAGDFILYQFATKYDPDALFDSMPRDEALAVGGIESTRTVRSVDKARVDSAIASGAIPSTVAPRIRTNEPRYKKPSKMELP